MGYIAPEIMSLKLEDCEEGKKSVEMYNYSCDIYSFGIIAYQLIVGSLPFKVESENFFDKKIVWVLFDREECKKIPQKIINFLQAFLEESPSKRISAKQALE